MKRDLEDQVWDDLQRKMVLLSGPRQVGKTTLAKRLMSRFPTAQYLNWDVLDDRRIMQAQAWRHDVALLVLDEIHKRSDWKSWLKGVVDARPEGQAILVTGSARLETFRQSGESLAGRYLAHRMHPIGIHEWVNHSGATPRDALRHLMMRGGFPEPCVAASDIESNRWRRQYVTDLVREDVVEFSRLQEVKAMQLLVELLRERVGSPVSYASLARDLGLSSATVKRYVDVLQALFVVFAVHPWHRNVARALVQMPKIYFYDSGLVPDESGQRLENQVACELFQWVQGQQDRKGIPAELNYIRTKDGSEVDFVLSNGGQLTHLLECKVADTTVHRALSVQSDRFPMAQAVQLVQDGRQEQSRGRIQIRWAADWLFELDA